jgi:hypothetical protein
MEEILKELIRINRSIQYQTKLLEDIFMKKDDARNSGSQQQMIVGLVSAMTETFKLKGMDPAPFEKLLKAMGGNRDEHQIP